MVTDAIAGTVKDTQGLKDVKSDVDNVFKFFNETLNVEQHSTVIKQRSIAGTTLIYGNAAFGIWGTGKWSSTANNSFVLGNSIAGVLGTSLLGSRASSFAVLRVVNDNNTWRESIRDTTFKDTTNTTATWDTTNYRWTFTGTQTIQTNSIFLNSTTVTNAKLTILSSNITSGGNLTYYLSADGGTNWEAVTLNTTHTFTNTGTDLRLKIVSSGNATIDIDDTNEVSTTVKVQYNI